MLKNGFDESPDLVRELNMNVRSEVGAFCTPDLIVFTPSLPMTRSGKIMCRILRKIVCGETDTLGDTSTLADPSIVDTLITKVTTTDRGGAAAAAKKEEAVNGQESAVSK